MSVILSRGDNRVGGVSSDAVLRREYAKRMTAPGQAVLRRHGAAPIWTPASLFTSGEQGVWYDPSDLSTLFQDSAGTTPVTAVGQSVGRVGDASGNGNHALQTDAAKRPVLQQDGNGNYYLQFDGVDDKYNVSGGFCISATQFSVAGFYLDDLAVHRGLFDARTTNGTVGVTYDVRSNGASVFSSGATQAVIPPLSLVAGTSYVLSGSATASATTNRLALGTTITTGPGVFTPSDGGAVIGGPRAAGGLQMKGRIYGLVVVSASSLPSTQAQEDTVRYLAGKSGATV